MLDKGDALNSEIAAFLNSVRSGEKPRVSAEDGLAAMRIAWQIKDQLQQQSTFILSNVQAPLLINENAALPFTLYTIGTFLFVVDVHHYLCSLDGHGLQIDQHDHREGDRFGNSSAAFNLSTPAVFKYDLALCESDVGCTFHVQTFN